MVTLVKFGLIRTYFLRLRAGRSSASIPMRASYTIFRRFSPLTSETVERRLDGDDRRRQWEFQYWFRRLLRGEPSAARHSQRARAGETKQVPAGKIVMHVHASPATSE